MAEKKKLVWFCNKILSRRINLDSFDDKLIIQKAIYLSQKLGMSFDYRFGWYVRGVYSSSLTTELYDSYLGAASNKTDYTPTNKDKEIVKQLQAIKNALDTPTASLELISSIVYASKDNKDEKNIVTFINRTKPWFSEADTLKAIKLVKKLPLQN
ncbi:MAG: hypothetical protein V1718_01995 [archaeon]